MTKIGVGLTKIDSNVNIFSVAFTLSLGQPACNFATLKLMVFSYGKECQAREYLLEIDTERSTGRFIAPVVVILSYTVMDLYCRKLGHRRKDKIC